LAFTGLNRTTDAIHDYDRATQLDSTLASAWLNRGMLHYQEQRYDAALDDVRNALAQGADPALAYYDLALVHAARDERGLALTCLEQVLERDPFHGQATRLREKLRKR